ncbi:hypothetical protein T492DRAFT_1084774 [Pavlovales sp. CCMP2436]|nr:hypothetical protein T492DRAFT_1084774 [Pavlovales sp. CCMP2436]
MGASCSTRKQAPPSPVLRSSLRASKQGDAAPWREHATTDAEEGLGARHHSRNRWSETGSLVSSDTRHHRRLESVSFDLHGRSKAPLLSVGLGALLITAFIAVPIVTLATISGSHADEPAMDAGVEALSVWQKDQILREVLAERLVARRAAAASSSGSSTNFNLAAASSGHASSFEELAGSLALLKGESPPAAESWVTAAAAARLARQDLAAARAVGDAVGAAAADQARH